MVLPPLFWRIIQAGPRLIYRLGLGSLLGKSVLLLITHGRKTGLLRRTPLVYERQGRAITVASARGHAADWLRNIEANANVQLQVGKRIFRGAAEVITDPDLIADYLERQIQRKPRFFGAILRAEGVDDMHARDALLRLAAKRPMVLIHVEDGDLEPES